MTQNSINNTASQFTIDPLGASDSFLQFDEATVGKWRIGNDATDDSYRISQGSALGTNDTLIITSAGERTLPLQPAFLAELDTTLNNKTGNATVYTVILDDEIFDQNADFNLGTSVFTAPVTGKYMVHASATIGATLVGCTILVARLVTSNRTYTGTFESPAATADVNDEGNAMVSVLADMDAADTVTFTLTGFNQGGDNVDVLGTDGGNDTHFAAALFA